MTVNLITPSPSSIRDTGLKINALLTEWAAATHAHGDYPALEMSALSDSGLLTCTLPGEPLDADTAHHPQLLDLLRTVGEGNLSVGRIFEGHINALQLIALYGSDEQKERYHRDVRAGHVFGVWNTEMADGVHFHREGDGSIRMVGSKSFCSGSVYVTRPIVTGRLGDDFAESGGWQMAVVPLDRHHPEVDKTFWTTEGMKNSVSHKVDFTGIHLGADDLLGPANAYNEQPHLSGGAVRFAAVQLGGAEAILKATRTYLRQVGREADPCHRSRVGKMVIAVDSGKLWLGHAGAVLNAPPEPEAVIFMANQVRTAIAASCRLCLDLSDQSVGARGMLPPQPLARLHADLRVYLRQPAPDATLHAVGEYFLNGPS